jgi:hypothetical protein
MSQAEDMSVVTLHVWAVEPRHLLRAFRRMAVGTSTLRRAPGVTFAKQLGTGGDRFTVRDADPRHWALVTAWASEHHASQADAMPVVAAWDRFAVERWRADLRPLSSRGTWSGRQPFGAPEPTRYDGPVAAITRARIRPSKTLTFYRSVPPVAARLQEAPGLQVAFGVGEWPVGLQGTFSLWDDAAALRSYAYEGAAHQRVIARTTQERWYGEELFARFAVLRATGTLHGRPRELTP